jgi:hypothetical protein
MNFAIFYDRNSSGKFNNFHFQGKSDKVQAVFLPDEFTRPHYNIIEKLEWIYAESLKNDYDIAVILGSNCTIFNTDKLEHYLSISNIYSTIFGFRISTVDGINLRYGPRIPFIDDNLIVMNVKNAKNCQFFARKLLHASHYVIIAGIHAQLSSLIEYSLQNEEFFNLLGHNHLFNQYGEQKTALLKYLSVCTKTSVISFESCGLSEANKWIEINTKFNNFNEDKFSLKFHNVDGYLFKKRWLSIPYWSKLKELYRSLSNTEFQKKYD